MDQDLFGRPSTADTGTRNAFDLYETPAWMVASLLEHHPIDRDSLVLEPCCGDGAIVRALEAGGFTRIITNDLDARHTASRHRDATDPAFWEMVTIAESDWVISNLPFNVAIHIVEHAVSVAKVGCAFLLRKTFTEPTPSSGDLADVKPTSRGPWLSIHPPTHTIALPRHSFRGDGSDTAAVDWFIWRKPGADNRRIPPFVVDWKAKSRRLP